MRKQKTPDTLERFSAEDVREVLRKLVNADGAAKISASLGFTPKYIYMVLGDTRPITEALALRLGFIKLPDAYVKAPNKQ